MEKLKERDDKGTMMRIIQHVDEATEMDDEQAFLNGVQPVRNTVKA
jgi:hypothetical protein